MEKFKDDEEILEGEILEGKRTFKEKVSVKLNKAKETVTRAARWCADNKELIIALTACGVSIEKAVSRNRRVKELSYKDRVYYDPVTGIHWQLKRKLSNDEFLYIERQKKLGRSVGDILAEIRVLK